MGKQQRLNFERKQIDVPYSRSVKFLPCDSETVVVISGLEGDIDINVDERFSQFGDRLSIYMNSPSSLYLIQLVGLQADKFSFTGSIFVDFVFDGDHFVSTMPLDKNGLAIGSQIKGTRDGIIYSKSGRLMQDCDHFFYDDTTKRLGIGNNQPLTTLSLCGNNKNGQIHVMNNDLGNGTSSIGFGKYGEEPEWLIGCGIDGDPSEVFCLFNTKTKKKYTLSEGKPAIKAKK